MFRLSPWNQERADLRMGILASVLANVNRGSGTKAYTADDFMPKFGTVRATHAAQPRKQTPSQMLEVFRQFTHAAGGTFITKPVS